jgi:acyl-CoA synthetase (NDP forming)
LDKANATGIRYFFEASSIAVVGVSTDETKLGSIIFSNLRQNLLQGTLKARLYPLSPTHKMIRGLRCYPGLKDLPEVPELLVVAVPASVALEFVKQAAAAGVKAVLMITGGFAEVRSSGLESRVFESAKRAGMRILGPNTIGILDTRTGVDSLFLLPTKKLGSGQEIDSLLKPLKGGVVIITQSGHLGEIVSEELAANHVGVRALVGTGNQVDVSVEDIINYFSEDKETKVIAVYLEGIKDGRRFMRLAGEAAKKKPIVVFKMGKTLTGARAALTHTASMVGDYQTYQAAFRASGIVEANSLQELADFCVTFSLLSQRPGKRLLVVTNAGGVGGVAADDAERNGLWVKPLSASTAILLRKRFGENGYMSNASLSNPLDLTATVPTRDFAEATEAALSAGGYDMGLILPTHQTPAIGPEISKLMARSILRTGKPCSVVVMGRSDLASAIHEEFLMRGIPSFPTPERAVRALAAISTYASIRDSIQTPGTTRSRDKAAFLRGRKGPLSTDQTRQLLSMYQIDEPDSVMVESQEDLPKAANLRFPVACKLASLGLLHKASMGGVVLNIQDRGDMAEALRRLKVVATEGGIPFEGMLVQEMAQGVELILGGVFDRTFGPTIVFGSGGATAQLTADYQVAVAPVNFSGARKLVQETKVFNILSGQHGLGSGGLRRLYSAISSFSKLMVENPSVTQLEINPLIVSNSGAFAADSRVVLGH